MKTLYIAQGFLTSISNYSTNFLVMAENSNIAKEKVIKYIRRNWDWRTNEENFLVLAQKVRFRNKDKVILLPG